jgi:hypothetical protein
MEWTSRPFFDYSGQSDHLSHRHLPSDKSEPQMAVENKWLAPMSSKNTEEAEEG